MGALDGNQDEWPLWFADGSGSRKVLVRKRFLFATGSGLQPVLVRRQFQFTDSSASENQIL